MRKIFAYSLVGLLLGVGLVALIEFDPGYVLVSLGDYTVETSFWVACFILAVFIFLMYLLLRLLRKFLGGKDSLTGWLSARKARQGARLTNRGLISFIEGNWSKSRRQLIRGAQGNEAPLLNYLVAARASYQLDEPDKMREYLGVAEKSEADAGIAVELTQAEIKLGARQYEQALATLVRARRNAGRHPHVLNLLRQAYEGVKDWQALLDLMPDLKKYKVMDEEALAELERNANRQIFEKTFGDQKDLDAVNTAWNSLPVQMKKDSAAVQRYLTALIDLDEHEAAGKFIVRALKQNWDSALVRLYAYVHGANSSKQLAQAETWLRNHEKDAQLQLCLGRLAARNELWGKARDYFENSHKLERTSEVCAELGRLLDNLGEERVSTAYYREGLLLQESELPELPMPDKAEIQARKLANG